MDSAPRAAGRAAALDSRRLEARLIESGLADKRIVDAKLTDYRSIAETLRAIPWEADPVTDRTTYVGPQLEALTGHRTKDWTADVWFQLVHPEDRDEVVRKYKQHLASRVDHNLEYRLITTSGRAMWFRDMITFATDDSGRELVRGLMIVIEEEKALERALRESEARYREAERIAKLMHWSLVLDPAGRWDHNVMVFSNAALEMLGIGEQGRRLTNQQYTDQLIHPDDRDLVRTTLLSGLANRDTQVSVTYRILQPCGSVRWVIEHVKNEYDETGKRLDSFGIIQDITEQRRHEIDMRNAYLSADLASRAKTQFLATMSHELRTPLNAIIGFSEAMTAEMMGPLGSPSYREYAADIHDSGTFLLSIINELLDLGLIDSGELKLDESLVQINKIVASCVALLRAKAANKGITLTQAAEPTPHLLRGDARRLKQAVLNLLSNAIKFTPSGGAVEIATRWSPDGLSLTVTDTGIGIAPADLDRVLKPFVQVENWLARKHEGAGLGLAITKGICDLHAGTLVLQSELGQGTVARITLPADRIETPAS